MRAPHRVHLFLIFSSRQRRLGIVVSERVGEGGAGGLISMGWFSYNIRFTTLNSLLVFYPFPRTCLSFSPSQKCVRNSVLPLFLFCSSYESARIDKPSDCERLTCRHPSPVTLVTAPLPTLCVLRLNRDCKLSKPHFFLFFVRKRFLPTIPAAPVSLIWSPIASLPRFPLRVQVLPLNCIPFK